MSSFFYRSSPRQNKDSTKMAIRRFHYPLLVFAFLSILVLQEAKTIDPYKVLGVDKNASQRDIQKAFHKLSLKYHPDKNKNKGAEERFAEINNAYEILSDEEKRKNYDLYGDEKGRPTYDAGSYGDHGGYTYFTNGGPGNNHFTSRPDGWQSMGGQGNSKSFSFSFGGDPTASGSSFNFGFNDIFSNFFGSGKKGGNQFGGFSNWGNSRSPSTSRIIQDVSYEFFKKEISDQGLTWLLLFYTPTKGYNMLESVIEEVANSLQGAIKVGGINCQKEQNLCKDLGVSPSKSARVFIYSYGTTERGSLLEYNGEWDGKSLKTFCQDHLPRFSRHVDLHQFDFSSTVENLPQVLLLSTRKDTPVIWRVLSGLYRKRFVFFDAEVHDVSDPVVRKLHVSALPAVVGRMSNGEVHVLRTGVVNDLKSGISELRTLLDSFEKKNKKAASSQGNRQSQNESQQKYKIPVLTGSNMDNLCSDNIVVCIIGIFRSSKAREKLESILHTVSQKTLMRQRNQLYNSRDSVSYSLLDATKQKAFLDAFDSSGFRSSDKLIVAFKPRKGKFAVFKDELTLEDVERFIGSVLNGDIQFMKVRQKPVVR